MATLEIEGKIIQALPEVGGTSAKGTQWRKREYVLETLDAYPKKVCFNFFNERIDQYPLTEGQTIKLFFDINSREFNGRWYTDISGWKVEAAGANNPQSPVNNNQPLPPPPATPQMPGGYSQQGNATIAGNDDGDLPF